MFHIVYKTANLINGKIYIGKHSTENLDDGYLGSGNLLLKAVKKHGKENFSREILHTCSSDEAAFSKEIELVTEEFVKSDSTYNIIVGGTGFPSGENHPNFGIPLSEEHKKRLHKSGEEHGMYGKHHSDETKKLISEKTKGKNNHSYGKKRPKEVVEKISRGHRGKKLSEEHKENLRKSLSGRTLSEQTKEKMRDSLRGRSISKEHIEKVRQTKRAKNPMYSPENLGLLKFLKSEGFSSAKIADQFNEWGIPSFKDKPHTMASVRGVFYRI
jgi:group I intron endonuclease